MNIYKYVAVYFNSEIGEMNKTFKETGYCVKENLFEAISFITDLFKEDSRQKVIEFQIQDLGQDIVVESQQEI